MSFTQGAESNLAGQFLERIVREEARARRVPVFPYSEDLDNEHLFSPVRLVERVPYKALYGQESISEFVLHCHHHSVRIECRVQETPGSVDEKFPYLVWNARECMPESEIIFLMHGQGARSHAMDWIRRQAVLIETKAVHIFGITEYRQWFKGLFK